VDVPGGDDLDLPEQMRVRRDKLDRMRAEGRDPYPVGFARTATLADVRAAHPELPPDTRTGETVAVSGRVIFVRNTGKLCFATLREGSGAELQAMLSLDRVGEQSLARWKSDVDLGDHVGVRGEVITSRRGELSVRVEDWSITAKSLRPLPVAHKPMSDELRVRQRYVDLVVRPDARQMLEARTTAVRSLRESLTRRGFLEVETPMLQTVRGGATARPFRTHIGAYDLDLYLRIAPELYLKRLVVGGVERVFEINRNFRNEGADSTHNPEFTMLEAYEAYGDYRSVADLTRALYQEAADAVFGSTMVRHADGREYDLGGSWREVSLHDAVADVVGEPLDADTPLADLHRLAERTGVSYDPAWTAGQVVLELFEKLVEHTLIEPTFVRDYPVEVRPLTRAHRDDPRLAESWDLVAFGIELGTGYSELVDPVEQRARLVEQARRAAGGDAEAMELDEDFLRALEYGMPPTGGLGTGVDRLLIALTGRGIRETITFPMVRPE